jgi:hypothetical protein
VLLFKVDLLEPVVDFILSDENEFNASNARRSASV